MQKDAVIKIGVPRLTFGRTDRSERIAFIDHLSDF